jgi:hypothetical protein
MGGSSSRAPSGCSARLNRTEGWIKQTPSIDQDAAEPDGSVIWEAEHAFRCARLCRSEDKEG